MIIITYVHKRLEIACNFYFCSSGKYTSTLQYIKILTGKFQDTVTNTEESEFHRVFKETGDQGKMLQGSHIL